MCLDCEVDGQSGRPPEYKLKRLSTLCTPPVSAGEKNGEITTGYVKGRYSFRSAR